MNVQQNALRLFNVGWCRLRKKLLLILNNLVLQKKKLIYSLLYHTLSQISKVYETIHVGTIELIELCYGSLITNCDFLRPLSKENTRKMAYYYY